jgi:excisionase family DNA binding protein
MSSQHPPISPPLFQPLNSAETGRGGRQQPPATPAAGPVDTYASTHTGTNRAGWAGDATDPPRELLRVEEAAARLAIGRTYMFALLRDQVIDSVKVGRLRRVPADALTAYITSLATNHRPATA